MCKMRHNFYHHDHIYWTTLWKLLTVILSVIVSVSVYQQFKQVQLRSTVRNIQRTVISVLLLFQSLLTNFCGVCGKFSVTLGAAGFLTLKDSISKLTESREEALSNPIFYWKKLSCLQTNIAYIHNQKEV